MRIDRFEDGFDDPDWGAAQTFEITPACDPPAGWTDEGVDGPAASECPPEASATPQKGGAEREHPQPPKAKGHFIKGPLCVEWITRAAALRKPALIIGMALLFKCGVTKDDFIRSRRAESRGIKVGRGLRTKFGLSPSQTSRGLKALAEVGLIVILKGGAGRCPVVAVVNIQAGGRGRCRTSK